MKYGLKNIVSNLGIVRPKKTHTLAITFLYLSGLNFISVIQATVADFFAAIFSFLDNFSIVIFLQGVRNELTIISYQLGISCQLISCFFPSN